MKTLIVALTLIAVVPAATSQVPEVERSVRKAIDLQVSELWEKEDFSKLERISADYREKRALTPSGLWRLASFYSSLNEQVSSDIDDPAMWEFMRLRAMKWTSRFPTSPSARLQYAQSLINHGWRVRGNGFWAVVTPQARKVFLDKLSEARAYLERHKSVAAVDPHWYELMINIANWQGWKEPQVKTIIEEAIEREPTFWQTYFAAAEYYSPHWHGDAQKIEQFASWAADRMGGTDGDALYTRIYWFAAERFFRDQFFDTKISCERMMRGVDQLMQTHPDPWNINHFASFAVSCGDRSRAKSLFMKIGDNPDLGAWGSSKTYARFKAWAME